MERGRNARALTADQRPSYVPGPIGAQHHCRAKVAVAGKVGRGALQVGSAVEWGGRGSVSHGPTVGRKRGSTPHPGAPVGRRPVLGAKVDHAVDKERLTCCRRLCVLLEVRKEARPSAAAEVAIEVPGPATCRSGLSSRADSPLRQRLLPQAMNQKCRPAAAPPFADAVQRQTSCPTSGAGGGGEGG